MEYTIDNKSVIYNSDTFYAFRDVKTDEIIPELLDKQKGFQQHFILIKNNIANETNILYNQLNVELPAYELASKAIPAYNRSFHQNEFDKKRFIINSLIDPKIPSLMKLLNTFNSFDGYFESSDFQKEFFKRYNKENAEVSYEYHKLVGQTKIKTLPNSIKMKLRFNKKMAVPSVNTLIIIKDTKTRKTKEYKYMSLDKLDRILSKHTVIQPTITLKLVYFNVDNVIDENKKEHIKVKYGVSIEVSKLIVYTNNFDKIIIDFLYDYYDNKCLMYTKMNKILIVMCIFYIMLFISIVYKKLYKEKNILK